MKKNILNTIYAMLLFLIITTILRVRLYEKPLRSSIYVSLLGVLFLSAIVIMIWIFSNPESAKKSLSKFGLQNPVGITTPLTYFGTIIYGFSFLILGLICLYFFIKIF